MVSPVEADWCLLFSLCVESPKFHWMQKKRNDQKEVIINHTCNLICNSFFFWLGAHIVSISTLLICWSFCWFLFHSMCGYLYPCISIVVFFCFLSLNWPACKMTLKKQKKQSAPHRKKKSNAFMIMQRQVSNIAFHSISANLGQKKQKNNEIVALHEFPLNLPNGESTTLKRWERLGVDCPLLVAFFFFFHFEHFLDTSSGWRQRREVWEEAEAILIVKKKQHPKNIMEKVPRLPSVQCYVGRL